VEGLICNSYFEVSDDLPVAKAFVEAYQAKYNVQPDMFAAATYEATMILAEALKKAGTEHVDTAAWREAVRDAIAATQDFPGVQGTINFDETGQAVYDSYVVRWKADGTKDILHP